MTAIDYIPGSFKTTMLPQWWGAAGDGVHDDAQAIQSAADYVASGGDVFLPPGPSIASQRHWRRRGKRRDWADDDRKDRTMSSSDHPGNGSAASAADPE